MRLEEAHALEAHARFVAAPARSTPTENLQSSGLHAVFANAVAAMGTGQLLRTAPPAIANPDPGHKPLFPRPLAGAGWTPLAATVSGRGSALLGQQSGDTSEEGLHHANQGLHGHAAVRPPSAASLLEDFMCVMPSLDSESACCADTAPPASRLGSATATMGAAANAATTIIAAQLGGPTLPPFDHLGDDGRSGCGGAHRNAGQRLQPSGSMESEATAGPSPGAFAPEQTGLSAAAEADCANFGCALLDGPEMSLDAGAFDELCHQLILTHGCGSVRPGSGNASYRPASGGRAAVAFGDWKGGCGQTGGGPAAALCCGHRAQHDALVSAHSGVWLPISPMCSNSCPAVAWASSLSQGRLLLPGSSWPRGCTADPGRLSHGAPPLAYLCSAVASEGVLLPMIRMAKLHVSMFGLRQRRCANLCPCRAVSVHGIAFVCLTVAC